jgi:galactokinase/mevalonate kinase-like predicted kinase
VEKRVESIEDYAWNTLNKKAITYIKKVVSNEIKRLQTTTHEMWEKLKTTYRNITPLIQCI